VKPRRQRTARWKRSGTRHMTLLGLCQREGHSYLKRETMDAPDTESQWRAQGVEKLQALLDEIDRLREALDLAEQFIPRHQGVVYETLKRRVMEAPRD
jgi:hypothetical protein